MSNDAMVVACPNCKKKYKFSGSTAGKKAKCKECETVFDVGDQEPATTPPSRKPPARPPARKKKPDEVAIDLAGVWTVLEGEYGGLPCFVRVNEALKPIAGQGHHSQSVKITIHFDSTGDNGMPTDEDDLARVEATEELLLDKLQTAGESLLAVVVTSGGTRELTFYSRDSQGAARRFEEAIPELPSRNVELGIEEDPEWSLYRQFVE